MKAKAQLDAWLDKHGARMLWERRGTHRDASTALYSFKHGACAVVVRYVDGGFSVFTETSSIDIAETLADAEKRMGLS